MGSSVSAAMNVTMVVPSLSRTGGGLFDSVRRLAQEVNKLEHTHVTAIGSADGFTRLDQPKWDPVTTTALKPLGPKVLGWTPALASQLAKQTPEVVHQHGLWTLNSYEVLCVVRKATGSGLYPSKRAPALVVSTHGMADEWALNHSKVKKSLAWNAYQRRQLQAAACIVVASANEGQSLRAQGITTPVAVVPNGVDMPNGVVGRAAWTKTLPVERKVLLFLGRLHPKKGLVPLLRAWANTMGDNPLLRDEWSLVCVGWGEPKHEAELLALAHELGLSLPHLLFTGPLFENERDLALHHAHALVLPSLSEGMPMSVLEGMAHGLPVLISDACNLPGVLSSRAGLCANPTPSSLSSALTKLTSMSDSERRLMGAAGQLLAQTKFSWSAIAHSMLEIYNWVQAPTQVKPELQWV